MVFNTTVTKMSPLLKKKIILSINENIINKKTIIGKKNILKNIINKKCNIFTNTVYMIITCNNIPTYLKIQLRLYSKILGIKLIEFDGGLIIIAL
uniref:Uncharacterized protein n=1 Tax=Lotharella vacuolata TaxID=74820 RepID=A0A0H5BH71_9EUKA|nr:hypothetical protein [Lotharella vacuolata]